MEPILDTEVRSASCGEETRVPLQFGEEIERIMEAAPPEAGSSFTALLELPANQAMELLHSPETEKPPPGIAGDVWSNCPQIDNQTTYALQSLEFPPTFPSNTALLERASRFSVFAAAEKPNSAPSNSSPSSLRVKPEPVDSYSNPNSSSPIAPNNQQNSAKRKERETKAKCSTKKSKNGGSKTDDGEQLPYVHVRARRGQATDSHSLAERARREKINARMKLLQDLVPGCNKISGTAMVLDEIINHVKSLQRQVEFLSMRLAAVNPRTDFNLDSLLAAESGSPVEGNFPNMVVPLVWPEGQPNGNRQHYQQLCYLNGLHQPVWARQDNPNLIGPENTLISYNSSTNSAALHSDQLKMEL